MSHKGIFDESDDDFEDESESGEDFSVSEDDWEPGKDDNDYGDSDDEDVDDASDDDEPANKKTKVLKKLSKGGKSTKNAPKLNASLSRRSTSSLRSKLFRKYNPPPKTAGPLPASVAEILSKSQYQKRKLMTKSSITPQESATQSDSESSDDAGLVNPNEFNFNSDFFNVNANKQQSNEQQQNNEPAFDCNAGLNLSDSSDNDELDEIPSETNKDADEKPSIIDQINKKSSNEMHDFSNLQTFAKNLESAKAQLEKLKDKELNTSMANTNETDITKLLSLGEGPSTSSRKRKHDAGQHSDDSEWENVSDDDGHANKIKDIQITVNEGTVGISRAQKKAIDLEACLKRRLNRDIKEKQVYLHKASVLCWIAHGNYTNRVLNNMKLMEMCLKLLPSKNAYPKGDTDIKYFHMVTEWFNGIFDLKSKKLYCDLKKLPPKIQSLSLQIQSKKVISKCDFVLLYVIMLRSLGLQCRLVINLNVPPLRPPQKDLFVVSSKPKDAIDVNPKSTKDEPKTLAKKIKTSTEKMKSSTKSSKSSSSSSSKHHDKSKSSESKASSSSKKHRSSSHKEADHKVENPKIKDIKVKLSRDPLMESNTVKPIASTSGTVSNTQKQSTTSKSKKPQSDSRSNKSRHEHQSSPKNSPTSNGKKSTKENGNAESSNAKKIHRESSSKSSGKSKVSSELLKKIEAISSSTSSTKKEATTTAHQPNKLNMANMKINVNALLPGAKHVSSSKKSDESVKNNSNGANDIASAERLTSLNRDRPKPLTRRPSTRDARKLQYQKSLEAEQDSDAAELSNSKPTKIAKSSLKSTEKSNLIGTPTKSKLFDRKNTVDLARLKNNPKEIATPSPRKTRAQAAAKATAGTSKPKVTFKLPQLDGAHEVTQKDKKKIKAKKPRSDDGSCSDSDFEPSPPKRVRPAAKPAQKLVAKVKIDRRVFSTDEEEHIESNTNSMNFWVEAYAEKEKKWIVIDPIKKKVDCVDHTRKNASKPIIYVFAWNNDNSVRDVTPRYCSQFHTTTRKQRAEQLWIDEALDSMLEQRNPRTIIEDVEFSKLHMDSPMPTSINEFKNHPMYALERHLLKFEAIYPRNALTLGYIRKEPIYARECVHTLHSREIWVKQARTVKLGEKPYKIVKARPKWNRVLNQMEEAKPLEIFGFWQTEPYKPPVAENGIVPRNPYGNVELFKPEMLPIGTRHIQLPNLNRICKKMGVDCAQAVIGFDFHSGSSHPSFDGFVVCEEFAEDVIMQWEIDREEQIRKETEKREARVYGNWKKLIKGLLIRERLKRKFNFGVDEKAEKTTTSKRKKE